MLGEDPKLLRQQAHKCRTLARATLSPDVAETLIATAREYDERAEAIDRGWPIKPI